MKFVNAFIMDASAAFLRMPSRYRTDVIRTYVDKLTTESFLQVLYECRLTIVLTLFVLT